MMRSSRSSAAKDSGPHKNVEEVIELQGLLWELPLDIGEALGDPRLSDCLLFSCILRDIGNVLFPIVGSAAESWEHKYRIVKEMTTSKKDSTVAATPHQINNRMVLMVTGARIYHSTEINEEEGITGNDAAETILTDRDEAVARITLPATHLIFPDLTDREWPTEVFKRLNVESIVTLGLLPESLRVLCDQLLLASAAPEARLLHLLIWPTFSTDLATKKYAEALVEKGLWLQLEGLALPWSVWELVAGVFSQGNKLKYLSIFTMALKNGSLGLVAVVVLFVVVFAIVACIIRHCVWRGRNTPPPPLPLVKMTTPRVRPTRPT